MLQQSLSLFSYLQIGRRLKEAAATALKQAAAVAAAGIVLLAAATFGLVAAYHGLVAYGFSSFEAAGLVAASLAAIALLILVVAPFAMRKSEPDLPSTVPAVSEGARVVQQGLGKAMQQVGPLTFLAIAFAGGLLAGRRR